MYGLTVFAAATCPQYVMRLPCGHGSHDRIVLTDSRTIVCSPGAAPVAGNLSTKAAPWGVRCDRNWTGSRNPKSLDWAGSATAGTWADLCKCTMHPGETHVMMMMVRQLDGMIPAGRVCLGLKVRTPQVIKTSWQQCCNMHACSACSGTDPCQSEEYMSSASNLQNND